jgi:hypothetical protein
MIISESGLYDYITVLTDGHNKVFSNVVEPDLGEMDGS